jgi:uncharacterized protein (TIGR02757 family)
MTCAASDSRHTMTHAPKRSAPLQRSSPELAASLKALYADFDRPESALDPIQIVQRYARVDDREIVGFVASALAFGRVASVIASVEAVCRVLGPAPAEFVRAFEPREHGGPLEPLVHRWTRGPDFIAMLWILRQMLATSGTIERFITDDLTPDAEDVGAALESFSTRALAFDLRPAYGCVPQRPGVAFFFSRPSTGSACKRLNLFLRWMVRRDAVDPGGWTRIHPRQLIVPLDTHTIRIGQCLRLTRRTSPGWKMAADITVALRRLDPDDPVRYDFSLCHLSMMGACGFATPRGSASCPLRGVCRPKPRP